MKTISEIRNFNWIPPDSCHYFVSFYAYIIVLIPVWIMEC